MMNCSTADMIANMEKVIIGKREVLELTMVTLLSEGHLLLEDVPGVGKTTLATSLAKTLSLQFGRIQFTPDTLPGDVLGVSIYRMQEGDFQFRKGVVMNQIVLADEINRTSPKTQSSLLEAMEERQVTVDGMTYPLPRPFMVIATQNPIAFLGTYHLPEAQLDRFFMKVSLGYPDSTDEKEMVRRYLNDAAWKNIQAVADEEDILSLQEKVKSVTIKQEIVDYILEIVAKTRKNEYVTLGASPRAALSLARGAQAAAFIKGRDFVKPEDVKWLVKPMLNHRLVLSPEAKAAQMTTEKVLASILTMVKVPV